MPKDTRPVRHSSGSASKAYTAKDIEVLEGLEPVRRRPGMYIGGTDVNALHHLAAEIIDNAMDEAVAGHASRIEMELKPGNVLAVRDNGRGIPVDPHPKFKNKSALEVIMTTLHAGGKFDGKAYETSRRPARRRRLGGQCPVGMDGSGSGARQARPQDALRARPCRRQAEGPGRGQPARHHRHASSPMPRFSATCNSRRRGSTAWPSPRPICSAAWKSAGPAIRR